MSEPTLRTWPTELAQRYTELGYWRGRELTAPIRDQAKLNPNKIALIDSAGQSLSYAQLDEAADRVAAALQAWGLKRGDRFILQLPNVIELVTLLFGSIRAGIIPVMVLPTHREQEVSHLARGSGAVAYAVTDVEASYDFRSLAQRVRQAVPSLQKLLVVGDTGSDPTLTSYSELVGAATDAAAITDLDATSVALFLHSGGTGGLPKLIPRTHNDYEYNARASAEICGFDDATVYLASLSAAHNFPLACPGILGTFIVGGTVVLAREPSPDSVFGLIAKHRVTVTAAVPTLAALWLEAREFDDTDLYSLRVLQVGGAKLAPSVAARIHGFLGVRVQQVFGMAEGLLNFTREGDPIDLVETTQGRPLSPHDEIRLVDEMGAEVADGEVGELWTRGPYTIRSYLAAPEANQRSFTADGFYRTGDLVRRLPSGHLMVEGRAGDQINRGAEKFSSVEIEEYLLDHPAVREIAVIGVPDASLGQASCAVVRPIDAPPSLRDLKDFLRNRGVATYKFPDRIRIVDEIPLTRFGKIDRKRLLAEFGQEAVTDPVGAPV
ncbi:(2,3-dihydroxybenzoyl)adenylate synthase [Rhizobium sp. P38BS-XIX]|uniref:(2,3-dihydroxybenzoyl)adenylate synthase n=1 Tax=Rhizobium sp. P38BS-XIX TaxID=2726740 RepID=UPI001457791D|nr:AMP-binding protein [Rhizobium sp. P38BS-XIX]NLR99824.1 (2,3-dihydroxybenzoyl)adenylate synthase [Rhizobium sp. P38BS-XIX]